MKKIFLLGWKDLTLAFRDRAALLLMLLAPFVLTLGLGLVTGNLSGSGSSGISGIQLVLVNRDRGPMGQELVSLFRSEHLAELVIPQMESNLTTAKQKVDADQIAAVVFIPPGFTAGILPETADGQTTAAGEIQLYLNPNRPTGAGIIQSIVEQFVYQAQAGRAGVEVTLQRLVESGLLAPQQAPQMGAQLGAAGDGHAEPLITLNSTEEGSAPADFNLLAYMAPGMALMFLMYTVANGGRSLLVEKTQGTLPRLLAAPVGRGQVLLGKMLGVFFTGLAQMLILILASTLLFRLQWGDPLAVLLLVIAAVAGAVGWGMLLTALVKTPGQASTYGSAVMLIFAILGGSFFDLNQFPRWFQILGRITPNAWGVDGFARLGQGGTLVDVLPNIGGLLAMCAVLFALSLYIFNRRGLIQ